MLPGLSLPALGATRWNPAFLGSKLDAWFDASLASSVSLSGSNVTAWRKRAGVGSETLTAATNFPTYPGNYVDMSSTGGRENLVAASWPTVWQMYIASRPVPSSQGFTSLGWIDASNGICSRAISSDALLYKTGGTSNSWGVSWGNTDGIAMFEVNGGTGGGAAFNGGSFIPSIAAFTASALTFLGDVDPATGGAQNWGRFYEMVLTNAVLSLQQQQKVEGYLAWKHGTQSLLPSGHPYKNAPP